MTRDEFRATSIALLRSAVGWQSAIARCLDVGPRQVRRWLHDDRVPDWAASRLAEMQGATEQTGHWPRDEWIVQREEGRRAYVVHTAAPRFIARVVDCDDAGMPLPAEMPADVVSGIVYVASPETLLCEIDWIDEPNPGHVTRLLDAAADAIAAE